MANNTASTIIERAWYVLKEDGTTVSTPGLQTTAMLAALSNANNEWIRAQRRAGGEPEGLAREAVFTLVATTALAEDITSATTDFDVDSATDLDSSGALGIWTDEMMDICQYTAKASNNIQGVTLIGGPHSDGDTVQKLPQLPSTFNDFREADGFGHGVQVNGLPYFYTSSDPLGFQFSSYKGTDGYTYLILPKDTTGTCTVLFNKTSTTIDSTDDTVDVSPEYDWFLVYRLAEYGARIRGDNPAKVQDAKFQADKILKEFGTEKNTVKKFRTRPVLRQRTVIRGVSSDYWPI